MTFIARGAHLEAIRERGLVIRSEQVGDFAVRVRATEDPRDAGPVDLVLFGVRTYDLEAIDKAGFTGWICPEYEPLGSTEESLSWLHEWGYWSEAMGSR